MSPSCSSTSMTGAVNLVIFGGTGDLAMRKIHPALSVLFQNELVRPESRILALGRTDMTSEDYQRFMEEKLSGKIQPSALKELVSRVRYMRLDPDQPESGAHLAGILKEMDADRPKNRLFYLSVPPTAYIPLVMLLGEAGLGRDGNGRSTRIVVEKPFGRDLPTARELDKVLHRFFEERQIFRIDHYMAKETVQNILLLRFANALFEPVWNRRYIDHISITAAESLGIGHRSGFYDQAGVLRDMFQNHMMMLLALCAMEPPSLFEAERVRDERAKVFRALRPLDPDNLEENLVLGQYGPGVIDGQPVPGYLEEPGVRPNSLMPTYAWLKVYLDNWRWQGVPFYLCSGKRLRTKHTEIAVQFRDVPVSMFRRTGPVAPNRLVLGIHPEEVVRLEVQTKSQGPRLCLEPRHMEFAYGSPGQDRVDDYAKVLLDCVNGDQTLFWRQDAVELCWEFLTPILNVCDCPEGSPPLHPYPAGSNGPAKAQEMRP